jgi:hypothetical protein
MLTCNHFLFYSGSPGYFLCLAGGTWAMGIPAQPRVRRVLHGGGTEAVLELVLSGFNQVLINDCGDQGGVTPWEHRIPARVVGLWPVLETGRDEPPELLRFPYLLGADELARKHWAAGGRATGVVLQDEAGVKAEVDRLKQEYERQAAGQPAS